MNGNRSLWLTGAVLLTLAFAGVAQAGIVPRNGFWGGSVRSTACDESGCNRTSEIGYAKLRNHKVVKVGYTVLVDCFNSDDHSSYDRYFSVRGDSVSRRLNRRGKVTFSGEQRSDGRRGEVRTTVDFSGRKAKLKLNLQVNGSVEWCHGFARIPLKRAPRR